MNRRAKLVLGAAGVVAAGVVFAVAGGVRTATGSIQLAVKLSTAAQIGSIERVISGNGITPLTGTITNTAAGEVVGGVPVGEGYAVELDATSANGAVTCKGATEVDVVAGETVQVNVILQCSDAKPRAGVTASGRANRCPVIASLLAAPTTGVVNGAIALRVKGDDADGDPLTFQWVQRGAETAEGKRVGALDPNANAIDSRSAGTAFKCAGAGTATMTVIASDGTCKDMSTLTVSCVLTLAEAAPAGTTAGGTAPGANVGASQANQTGTSAVPGAPGAAAVGAAGGQRTPGGLLAAGALGAAVAGQAGSDRASSTTPTVPRPGAGMPDGGSPEAMCQLCAFGPTTSPLCGTNIPQGCANCSAATDGCDEIADEEEKDLCETVLGCFMGHARECVVQGDPLRCWCGTNPTTCVTSNEGATRANGVCLAAILAAARTEDAPTIKQRFVDAKSALGRAVLMTQCLGTFCSKECGFP